MTDIVYNPMQFKHQILFFILCVAFTSNSQSQNSNADSVLLRPSLFIIPHPAYQQETSWSAGIAGGYYFKSKDLSRISSISGSADYTLLKQFIFNITPKIFFGDNKWYLYSNLNFRNYPDFYYGIGNKTNNLKQSYVSNIFSINLQPQYALNKHIHLGAIIAGRHEKLKANSNFETIKDSVFSQYGSEGWNAYSKLNIGILASFDSRDNQFYPQKGIFAKSSISTSKAGWGSTYTATDISLDFRQFIPLFNNHVFAWQGYFSGVYSANKVAFQMLPSLGGLDFMRGFRQGMYRDNTLILLQTEYRLPIYKSLKAAVFCSTGDVLNINNQQIDKLKLAYGAGLRYRLNDARVHLRLDLAKNNYGEKLQFYITATEAF